MGITVGTNSSISSFIQNIEAGTKASNLKDSTQVRLSNEQTLAGGEKIFEATTKNGSSVLSARTAAVALDKIGLHSSAVDSKVNKHYEKLDNWDVFKGLAKNELREALQDACKDCSDAAVDELLEPILQEVKKDTKNFDDHKVRWGPLTNLANKVQEEVRHQRATSDAYATVNKAGDGQIHRQRAGGEGSASAASVASNVSTPALDSDGYATTRHAGFNPAASSLNLSEGHYDLAYPQSSQSTARVNTNYETAEGFSPLEDSEYSELNHNGPPAAAIGGGEYDVAYPKGDQGTVHTDDIYEEIGYDGAVENSADVEQVKSEPLYGNLTEAGKPALAPKPDFLK